MKRWQWVVLVAVLHWTLSLPGWAQAVVTGIVVAKQSGRPIPGATVYLEKSKQGAVTQPDGRFVIANVPAGSDVLIVRSIGYRSYRQPLQLRSGDTLRLRIALAEATIELQKVVVAASKRVQSAQEVPVSVSVVGIQNIELRGHTQLDQVLRYVPGVYVTRDQVNIRGTSGFALGIGSRTFVLLDGFPFLAGDGGDVKFDALPLFVARQVEVIKGGGSALYGSGALGGVVNVVTASPESERPIFRFRLQGGGYSLPKYSEWQYRSSPPLFASVDLAYARRWKSWALLAAGGYDTDEGYHAFYDSRRYRAFAKVEWKSDAHQLRIIGNFASNDRADWVYWRSLRFATLPPETVDTNQRVVSDKMFGGIHWQYLLSPQIVSDLKVSLYRTAFETVANGEPVTDFQSSANSWNVEEQLTATVGNAWTITGGFQGIWNRIGESFVGRRNQRLLAAYAQVEWQHRPWVVTAGARWDLELLDVPRSRQSELSPKLGVVYQPVDFWQWRLSLGKGFRIPTMGERFSGLRYGPFLVKENPELKPEENWSAELGTTYQWFWQDELWKAELTAFSNWLTNLVEPRLLEGAVIQFVNVERAVVRGIEASIEGWLPHRWLGLQLHVLAVDPWNLSQRRFLKYRSRWLLQSRLILPLLPAVQVEGEYRYQKKFDTVDEEVARIIPDADARVDAHVVDLRCRVDLSSWLPVPIQAVLNVSNALNYYYTEVLANLAPFRAISLQLSSTLGATP